MKKDGSHIPMIIDSYDTGDVNPEVGVPAVAEYTRSSSNSKSSFRNIGEGALLEIIKKCLYLLGRFASKYEK